MSRIGESVIKIPTKVTVEFDAKAHQVMVKGAKGELRQVVAEGFQINVEGDSVTVQRPNDDKRNKSLHGLYRALIANMVEGVSAGYTRKLELIGVGYKATTQNNVLELSIGYSHSVFVAVPPEIKVDAVMEKGANPLITLQGIDKQLIGHVGAKIKSLRKKDPYKGKGIYYVGEYVRRKVGKAASK